jgi:hypothetical protein
VITILEETLPAICHPEFISGSMDKFYSNVTWSLFERTLIIDPETSSG